MASTEMNYLRTGNGPALVLIHGYLLGAGFWRRLVDILSDRFEIITPDLPGFAGSGHLPPEDTIENLSGRVVRLLDGLGIDRFSVMGHSMGGMIAQQMALDFGDRIERLIVYGASAGGPGWPAHQTPHVRSPAERKQVLEKEGVDGLRRWMAPYWFAAGEDSPYLEECYRTGEGGSELAARRGADYIGNRNIWDRLNAIHVPTLVIGGDRDRTFSVEAMAQTAQGVLNGQLCIIPGAAHCPHYEKAVQFDLALNSFLSE